MTDYLNCVRVVFVVTRRNSSVCSTVGSSVLFSVGFLSVLLGPLLFCAVCAGDSVICRIFRTY